MTFYTEGKPPSEQYCAQQATLRVRGWIKYRGGFWYVLRDWRYHLRNEEPGGKPHKPDERDKWVRCDPFGVPEQDDESQEPARMPYRDRTGERVDEE